MKEGKMEEIINSKRINKKLRYGIRKLSVGVVSVVLGAVLVFSPLQFKGNRIFYTESVYAAGNQEAYDKEDKTGDFNDIEVYTKYSDKKVVYYVKLTGGDGEGWRDGQPDSVKIKMDGKDFEELERINDKSESIGEYKLEKSFYGLTKDQKFMVKIFYKGNSGDSGERYKDIIFSELVKEVLSNVKSATEDFDKVLNGENGEGGIDNEIIKDLNKKAKEEKLKKAKEEAKAAIEKAGVTGKKYRDLIDAGKTVEGVESLRDEIIESHKKSKEENLKKEKEEKLKKAKEEAKAAIEKAGVTGKKYRDLIDAGKTIEGVESLRDEIIKSHKKSKEDRLKKAKEEAKAAIEKAGVTGKKYRDLIDAGKTIEGVESLRDEIIESHKKSNPQKDEDKEHGTPEKKPGNKNPENKNPENKNPGIRPNVTPDKESGTPEKKPGNKNPDKVTDKENKENKEKKDPSLLTEEKLVYIKGSNKEVIFKIDAEKSSLVEITVDGKPVSSENYELMSGSTIVKFKIDYLESLALGKHSIESVFNETDTYNAGRVKTELVVAEGRVDGSKTTEKEKPSVKEEKKSEVKKDKNSNPNTGDLGVATTAVSTILAGAALVATRKKYKK